MPGVGVTKGEARVVAALAGEIEKNLGLVDAGDGGDVRSFRQSIAEVPGAAPDIKYAVTVGETAKFDQQRR
jgi:hypothetical protein